MSFEEAKKKVAKHNGWPSFEEAEEKLSKHNIGILNTMAAKIYATSQYNQALEDVRSKAKEQDWYYSDLTIDELKK